VLSLRIERSCRGLQPRAITRLARSACRPLVERTVRGSNASLGLERPGTSPEVERCNVALHPGVAPGSPAREAGDLAGGRMERVGSRLRESHSPLPDYETGASLRRKTARAAREGIEPSVPFGLRLTAGCLAIRRTSQSTRSTSSCRPRVTCVRRDRRRRWRPSRALELSKIVDPWG
jgi:hypothetical protein